MKASGKIGSNGVQVSDNVKKRFETDIYIYIYIYRALILLNNTLTRPGIGQAMPTQRNQFPAIKRLSIV